MILAPGLLAAETTLQNPVAPDGQDPWVIQTDGAFYYCYSYRGAVHVNRAGTIERAVRREGRAVWRPERGRPWSRSLWAPELHFVEGRWYIYVAADDGQNVNHRMYVLQSRTSDPTGPFDFKGQIADPTNKWAIDGTVMRHGGELYFIWSGWAGETNVRQDLYIARMDDPLTIRGERVMISKPEHGWETVGRPTVNEGPQVLVGPTGRVFLVYSASGSWTDHYCLGLLELTGADPMDASAWTKSPKPIFKGTDSVISPGHASFTKSPDGQEDWIVYHAAKHKGARWNREVHMKRFAWDTDGRPVFGEPVAKGVTFAAPAK
jgi:GH43 family beta-xylosidase